MKIDKSLCDDYAILTLKGEFDTFYVPSLQVEIDGLLEHGVYHIILNMRLVKFVNSTALGGIIKAHKLCKAQGGELLIAQPSAFVKEIIGKVGIDQLVPVYDEEDQAVKHIVKALNAQSLAGDAPVVDHEKVLISFSDETRNQMIGGQKTIVGTMCNVDGNRVQFLWSGKALGLSPDQSKQIFFEGSEANLKFQVKLFKKGYFEVVGTVADVQNTEDGQTRVTAKFKAINEGDRTALSQFAQDMEFLKQQLPSQED